MIYSPHKERNIPLFGTLIREATYEKADIVWNAGFFYLLGLAGVFTEARGFLGFFAFAVDFQYFFLKSDEMLEAQLARSASRAFVVGMLMMAAAVLGTLTLGGFTPQRALLTGCTVGWAASVVVYALTAAWYGFRESWGLEP